MSADPQTTDPVEIAHDLTENGRIILIGACRPLAEQDTFPGPLSPDRAALIVLGLVVPCGYFVEATDLGRKVAEQLL